MPEHNIRIGILGGGCAGLSLARQLAAKKRCALVIADAQKPGQRPDHSWGFWHLPDMDEPFAMARKTWRRWQIITATGSATQEARQFAYAAVESKAWLTHCRLAAQHAGAEFLPHAIHDVEDNKTAFMLKSETGEITVDAVYDSRTPSLPEGIMLQHFLGWEIETENPCFDENNAVLMDFRCDQSRGIHFIYILPYSAHRALVESTLFTPKPEDSTFYEEAIETYCSKILHTGSYRILRREQGVIPMGFLQPRDPALPAIGGNGGAIRPSSGYAFSFILKQIRAIGENIDRGEWRKSASPHQQIDLWMDRIFLRVLRRFPGMAPRLFLAMGKALDGDAMALFMAGEASWGIRLKVILAMPKWPFILALMGMGKHSHG